MRFPAIFTSSKDDYEALPSNSNAAHASTFQRLVRKTTVRQRIALLALVSLPLLAVVAVYRFPDHVKSSVQKIQKVTNIGLPPTYDRFYELESNFPQHDPSLPFPEGENGRFMWVSNQHWGLGWNNIFQPLYMMELVAYLSNRAYVFEPYTWDRTSTDGLSHYGDNIIPARIPLSALMAGPMAGGGFPEGDSTPRAVNEAFFKKVCPEERRVYVSIKEVNEGLDGKPVNEVVEKYVQVLKDIPEGCVEVKGDMEHPFDWMHFGDASMNTAYPLLASTPLFEYFSWSPLVLSALTTNAHLITPLFATTSPALLPDNVPDMMALHIRRGDYIEHCQNLASWSSRFMGWNSVPGLANTFDPPPGGSDKPENREIFMRHCFPEVEDVVNRVMEAKNAWEGRDAANEGVTRAERILRRVYIATNGKRDWVSELEGALRKAAEWEVVVSGRDISLTDEQVYVAQAVDMAIAERAAVFVGNGFSSMTANINLIRRLRGHPLVSSWFW